MHLKIKKQFTDFFFVHFVDLYISFMSFITILLNFVEEFQSIPISKRICEVKIAKKSANRLFVRFFSARIGIVCFV